MVENRFYGTGMDANFILIDASNPKAVGQRIERIPLSNINETDVITANEVSVEWYNFTSASLTSVRLGGIGRWSGLAASGERLALTPAFRINPRQSFSADSDNIWQFWSISVNVRNKIHIIYDTIWTPRPDFEAISVSKNNNELIVQQ